MKVTRKSGLFFGILIAGGLTLSFADRADAVPCVNGTALTSTCTITVGGLTISDFLVVNAGNVPTPEIDLVNVGLSALEDKVVLDFNPNLSAPPSGPDLDLHFTFTVTGGVDRLDLGVGGVGATIIERACISSMVGNGLCPVMPLANIIAFSAPPGPSYATSAFFDYTSPLYVYKDIGVAHGGGLTEFEQTFTIGTRIVPPAAAVPEPASIILLGTGMLGLAFSVRQRNRGKKTS
jgi:hypothetical protein